MIVAGSAGLIYSLSSLKSELSPLPRFSLLDEKESRKLLPFEFVPALLDLILCGLQILNHLLLQYGEPLRRRFQFNGDSTDQSPVVAKNHWH